MIYVYISAALFACFVCFVAGFNLGCRFTQSGQRAQDDWLAKVRRKSNVRALKRPVLERSVGRQE